MGAAAEVGNTDVLEYLLRLQLTDDEDDLEAWYKLSTRPNIMGFALQMAIEHGQSTAALLLLDNGADIDGPLLAAAVEARDYLIVRELLDAGVDVNVDSGRSSNAYRVYGTRSETHSHASPLQLAVEWGDQSVIDDLLDAGSDVNVGRGCRDDRDDRLFDVPLTTAVKRQDAALISRLLVAGADVYQRCRSGANNSRRWSRDGDGTFTALSLAIGVRDADLVNELLAYGPDFHDSDALHQGWLCSHDIFKLLLQHYSQKYPRGKKGFGTRTLRDAIEQEQLEVVKALVKHRVDWLGFCADDFWRDQTALGAAIRAPGAGQDLGREIVRLLVQAVTDQNCIVAQTRCSPWSPDSMPGMAFERETALLVAIDAGNEVIVRLLLELGADVNRSAGRGVRRTPLQKASEVGNFKIVQHLLQCGANVNAAPAQRGGATALQTAAIGGYMGIAELLLDNGADVNEPKAKAYGRSALEAAAEHGRISMVEMLLSQGAVIERAKFGLDAEAVRLAEKNGHGAVADVIRIASTTRQQLKNGAQPSLVCGNCGKSFPKGSSLARHMVTVHSAGPATQYNCVVCHESFARKDSFDRHRASHEKNGPSWVTCPGCDKRFRKDYLPVHLQATKGEPCRKVHAVAGLPIRLSRVQT